MDLSCYTNNQTSTKMVSFFQMWLKKSFSGVLRYGVWQYRTEIAGIRTLPHTPPTALLPKAAAPEPGVSTQSAGRLSRRLGTERAAAPPPCLRVLQVQLYG